ncbi:MAG TPA: histidine--tRNA ligase [Candidatus Taylorbacteria bacterium]|nr:MAG: Histidine-tRNA ligase [Parcubacteria group bacterium GW2011_GWA2_47_64]KKU96953.1 MAG: Histidine-tRNA ligase [Parcubacteria group bacterium GW2011_GWC2_48_17]HBV00853.1 histidine--tRNA ligase [Candidatus Taylorbacteria bacterium]
MAEAKKKLSTEPYKGVRDFYPQDFAIEKYIFDVCRKTAESFGYEEYAASPLENAELYRAKSGEELVNEQTYTFVDRGKREVTLRPEMTPSVARMIAAKRKTLFFPVRWYSIQNFFRYERPQKGRLREHFQLNADIFGVNGIEAETEIIALAYEVLRNFGMKDLDFEIRVNSRKVMNYIIGTLLALSEDSAKKTAQLIDRRAKMEKGVFEQSLRELVGEKNPLMLTLLNSQNFEEFISHLPEEKGLTENLEEIKNLISALNSLGITNVIFDQSLMRGFDYYTGLVFEVYDKHPGNLRSMFGGGRYDDLLDIFGVEKVPTVGFGMGDVTVRDMLFAYGLLPKELPRAAELYMSATGKEYNGYVNDLAQTLRRQGIRVIVDYSEGKVSTKIKNADRVKVPYVSIIGEHEKASGEIKVKELATGKEVALAEDKIATFIKNNI